MEENGTMNSSPKSISINSKSYIILDCSKDGNIIELRTDPPTLIYLQKGVNTLTIEKYPELKYGFKAHKDEDDWWGDVQYGIIKMDFSHFDSSEMTCMDEMFCGMNINPEDLKTLDTSKVNSMVSTFEYAEFPSECKLVLNTGNVVDMTDMFHGAYIESIDLSSFSVKNVITFGWMFAVPPHKLIIDGWKINEQNDGSGLFKDVNSDYKQSVISLKGCDNYTIEWIFDFCIIDCFKRDFDSGLLKLELSQNKKLFLFNNRVKVIGSGKHNVILSPDGKTLTTLKNKNVNLVLIPHGVEEIADNVFDNCERLHTIVLPDTIQIIGNEAFKGCKSLRWINIPDKVRKIGSAAFQDCYNLRSLYIGDDMETIEIEALRDSGLQFLSLPLTVKIIDRPIIWGIKGLNTLHLYVPEGKEDEPRLSFDGEEFYGYNNTPRIIIQYPTEEYPKSKNGIYLDWYNWDEFVTEETESWNEGVGAMLIPDDIIEIPDGVEYLAEKCIGETRKCPFLYIPTSIKFIHPAAFGKADLKFITINVDHLLSVLPEEMKDNEIYLI